MCTRLAHHLLAVLGVDLDRDHVAHGARGNEQAGFFAEKLRGALFQAIDGRIFAVNVVAHFGFGHGAAHGGGRPRDGVAAKIDHTVINSAKTSLDKRTPRLVSLSRSPSLASNPSSTKRWIGASNLRHSSGCGRMPSVKRRPTKNRSSARFAGVDTSRGD